MTRIDSNGSKWAGEEPDSIETLCEVLQSHVLDRTFEGFGNFAIADPGQPVRFWGNFLHLSHVFSIDTDEPALIDRLTNLIRANQQRADYLSQPSLEQRRIAEEEYRASENARRIKNRRDRGIQD